MKKSSPGQMRLPWDEWEATNQEIEKVASRFIFANCYDSQKASIILQAQQEDFFLPRVVAAYQLFLVLVVFVAYLLVLVLLVVCWVERTRTASRREVKPNKG
ncbi:hypothetical protein [Nostoc sp.]|uniref:hypothetical protein n=1 Tax=Nostoc sp. TaxID=1180 RepID=UPI002FFBC0F9